MNRLTLFATIATLFLCAHAHAMDLHSPDSKVDLNSLRASLISITQDALRDISADRFADDIVAAAANLQILGATLPEIYADLDKNVLAELPSGLVRMSNYIVESRDERWNEETEMQYILTEQLRVHAAKILIFLYQLEKSSDNSAPIDPILDDLSFSFVGRQIQEGYFDSLPPSISNTESLSQTSSTPLQSPPPPPSSPTNPDDRRLFNQRRKSSARRRSKPLRRHPVATGKPPTPPIASPTQFPPEYGVFSFYPSSSGSY